MRNRLFMISIFGLISSPVWAQPDLGVALKGGPDAATLTQDYRDNRYGFSGGLAGYLQWSLGGRLSLASQIELLYTPRGAQIIDEGMYFGKIRQHYIDLMFVVRPAVRLGSASVYPLLGGGLNLLLSANLVDASGMKSDYTDDHNRIDVALVVGAGVAFQLPRREIGPFHLETVFLEARHDRGLIETIDGGAQNRTTSLMLGLSIALTPHQAPSQIRPANQVPST